jgi:hypothetical protein
MDFCAQYASFGPDLVLDMYSPLVQTVPEPNSEKLHMVVNHSSGKYLLNSMIDLKDIAGVKLDGIASLGVSLQSFRQEDPVSELAAAAGAAAAAGTQQEQQ